MVERVRAAGSEGLALQGDMTVDADADRVVAQTLERFGRLDIVVNAVGGGAGKVLHPAEEYPRSDWDWIMELNVRSTVVPTQAAVQSMIAAGHGGAVLNLSSVRSILGINAGYSAYVAAKGAISSLTRQWATEWATYGIRVNGICPTITRTGMTHELLAQEGKERELARGIPLRRICEPRDIAAAVVSLLPVTTRDPSGLNDAD